MNELDMYQNNGGELAPYAPSPLSPLAPASDTWDRTDALTNQEIADHQNDSGQVQLFGTPIPGATPQQVAQTLNEIQAVIAGDLMRLGHPQSSINAAIVWFQNNARKTPVRETKRHSYNLHDQKGDLVAESFGNAMAKAGASQEFISNCLWLLGELNKRLGASQGKPAHGRAPQTSDPTADLTDAEYERVVKINDAAKAQTYGYLESLWGQSFKSNLRMVDAYYAALPQHEQAALDVFTTGWVKALNTKEIILGLYKQAIGYNSLPSGGAVATEIAEHEHVMKTDRKRWMADERLQARYRELITLRDGR